MEKQYGRFAGIKHTFSYVRREPTACQRRTGISRSADRASLRRPMTSQQTTPTKRSRPRVIEDSSEDEDSYAASEARPLRRLFKGVPPDASPTTQQAAQQPRKWETRKLFKGRSARTALNQRVAVTYLTEKGRETFIGTVVNACPSQGLSVEFVDSVEN